MASQIKANNDHLPPSSHRRSQQAICRGYVHLETNIQVCACTHLISTGFSIKTPTGVITAHARLLLCTVDLPARACVLNMKQFNGKNGCSYCEDEGEPRASNHLHRNWPYTRTSISRSHHSIMTNARDAIDENDPVSFSFIPVLVGVCH